jgi:hypothetical protein
VCQLADVPLLFGEREIKHFRPQSWLMSAAGRDRIGNREFGHRVLICPMPVSARAAVALT